MIQRPKGTRDLLPEDTYKWQELESNLKEVLENGLSVETLGVDGFIPGNEVLTLDQNGTIKDYYNVGDEAQAEIIDIKPLEWKLRLSIKRIKVREERKAFEKYLEADDTKVTIGDLFKEI